MPQFRQITDEERPLVEKQSKKTVDLSAYRDFISGAETGAWQVVEPEDGENTNQLRRRILGASAEMNLEARTKKGRNGELFFVITGPAQPQDETAQNEPRPSRSRSQAQEAEMEPAVA